MKKASRIIGSLVIATVVTYLSLAIVRTNVADVCHVYQKVGFPLSFIETLLDQPSKDQCLPFALSKSHPTYNVQNLAIDWAAYFIVSVAGLAVIGKKKRHPHSLTPAPKDGTH